MEGSPITGLDRGQGRLVRHDPSPSAGCRCHTPLSWVTGVPPVLSVGKRAGRPFPLGFAVPITPKPQPPRGFGASPGAATLGQHRRRNMTPSPSASCCQTKTRWPHRGVSPPPLLQLRSGFSLIELLVVIAIIVILAVLSFQAVGAMRARGESAKCMSNLRSMGVAIQLYANDHDGRYPGPVWYSASWEIQKWGGYAPITLHLAPYLGLPAWSAMEFPKKYKVDAAICPTHQRLGSTHAHYARHADPAKSPFGGEAAAGFSAVPPRRTVTASQILGKKNSEIMALRDWPLSGAPTPHHGGQNVLFLDGHVSWIKGDAEPP